MMKRGPIPRRFTVLTSAVLTSAILTLAGCTSDRSAEAPAAGPATADEPAGTSTAVAVTGAGREKCRRDYTPRPLPSWATAGFQPPSIPMPYVLGDGGDIVAILWSDHDPLVVPPAAGRNNKILWVARVGAASSLDIRARSVRTGESVARTVEGGPGPSTVDLPSPGCWSFDLTWGEEHDHLLLRYAPR